MVIAYLVNQYPKISHSFIRREISGLEAAGLRVARFSLRPTAEALVDAADQQEQTRTRAVLGVGKSGLLTALIRVLVQRPQRFLQALGLALKLSWKSERGLLVHLAYLAEACVLLRWFAAAEVRHVHAHFGTNPTTVALLCHALGGPPYSFTVHGPEEFDQAMAIALPSKIQRAEFVVAVSSFGKSQLYRWCDYPHWPKIKVIHCGVDRAFLEHPFTPISDQPRLVCVGRLSEQKGHLLLLEAAAQLATAGVQFQLVLVGDGPLRSHLETLIARYGLEDHVSITGWANGETVKQEILKARALVLPSFAEGLPVVIMEALALGRPVISTYVAGIPELVQPEVSGWLVPPGSVEALTAALRAALSCPVGYLERMGRAGAARVAQDHQAEQEAAKLAALFSGAFAPAGSLQNPLPASLHFLTPLEH